MTAPVPVQPATGLARVHVYNRAGTSTGVLSPTSLAWVHSKSLDGSSVSFTANALDPAMVTTPSMLEDALAVVEVNIGGTWTPVGTGYALAPGSGTVVGDGASREKSPVGVGALAALTAEWLVLHTGGVVNRRGPTDRFIGWQSVAYTEGAGLWHDVFVVTAASLSSSAPKYQEPAGWPAVGATADWVYRAASEGDLTLFRFGTFVVSTAQKYIILFSCDEEAKVYLDGPGQGGIIIESSDQETGYTVRNVWKGVLQPGTYQLAAEMTTVVTPGGDGFDAARAMVATVNSKGQAATVVLKSDSSTRCHRQAKEDVRPGLTVGAVVALLRSENVTWGIPSATLLAPSFTGTNDTASVAWPAGQERVWTVGTTVAQVLTDLEIDASFDVSTSFALQAWSARGAATAAALVRGADPATASMNLTGYAYTSDPATGTRAVVYTQNGFVQVIDTAAEAVIGARGMFLESGASGSIGKGTAYGLDAIKQGGRVRRYYSAEMIGVTGSVPEVNFTVCDTVAAYNYLLAAATLQVLSISGANAETHVAWSLELGEV